MISNSAQFFNRAFQVVFFAYRDRAVVASSVLVKDVKNTFCIGYPQIEGHNYNDSLSYTDNCCHGYKSA